MLWHFKPDYNLVFKNLAVHILRRTISGSAGRVESMLLSSGHFGAVSPRRNDPDRILKSSCEKVTVSVITEIMAADCAAARLYPESGR